MSGGGLLSKAWLGVTRYVVNGLYSLLKPGKFLLLKHRGLWIKEYGLTAEIQSD